MNFDERLIKTGTIYDFQISPTGTFLVGNGVILRNIVSIEVNNGAKLELDDNVYLNNYSSIRCFHSIKIGKNTMMGDGVRIYDFDHSFSAYHIGRISSSVAPVVIGKNTWIGANCVITKGVTIGDNVIVGAGTVVTKDIPDNSMAYGQQQLVIKERKQNTIHAFILTASDRIESIEYLLSNLTNVDFHIAAPTRVSPYLENLGRSFTNCQVYPLVYADYSLGKLLEQADYYLDINYGHEVDNILNQVIERGIRVLSFAGVCHDSENKKIQKFNIDCPSAMVSFIRREEKRREEKRREEKRREEKRREEKR